MSRAASRSAMAIATVLATACEEPPPPWAGQPNGDVLDESEPFLPDRRSALLSDGGTGGEGGVETGPEAQPQDVGRPPGRHGGLWLSCHDRFTVSGEPRRDVTRLALSCGPVTGMRRASELIEGSVDTKTRSGHRFSGRAGHCYRVFVAGGDGIAQLDVRVVDGGGEELAHHRTIVPWAAVEPARPFCLSHDTPLTLSVDARGGAGAFAAEVWAIPPRERGL